jgi:hypothetical protein
MTVRRTEAGGRCHMATMGPPKLNSSFIGLVISRSARAKSVDRSITTLRPVQSLRNRPTRS